MLTIPIKCPSCGRTIKKPASTLKNGATFDCTCGQSIVIEGNGFTDAEKSLEKFKKSIGNLKFKL